MITYKEINTTYIKEIKEIYRLESWNAYLRDDAKLERAWNNSIYSLGAFDGEALVGCRE